MADPKEDKKKKEKADTKAKGKEKASEDDDEDDDSKGSGAIIALVAVLIVLIWLVIFAILIKMDVGGFGSTVMYPILKDVPYLNKILPEQENVVAAQDAQYQYSSMDEAVDRIKELEGQLKEAQSSASSAATDQDTMQQLEQELQQYKDNEAEFEKEKSDWYQDIVYNNNAPDASEYKKYYEEIDPANAEALYKQVVAQEESKAEIDDYVKAYSSMKPAEAASIFNTMTDNLSLVAKILKNMDAESRGNILGQMNADTAAKVTEIMNP